MRDIKFRGKRLDNGEWVYGDLLQYYDSVDVEVGGYGVDRKTVGQYISKCKCYEGDILLGDKDTEYDIKINDFMTRSDVVFKKKIVFVKNYDEMIIWLDTLDAHITYELIDYLKVIGNIYDNPELLG